MFSLKKRKSSDLLTKCILNLLLQMTVNNNNSVVNALSMLQTALLRNITEDDQTSFNLGIVQNTLSVIADCSEVSCSMAAKFTSNHLACINVIFSAPLV